MRAETVFLLAARALLPPLYGRTPARASIREETAEKVWCPAFVLFLNPGDFLGEFFLVFEVALAGDHDPLGLR